MKIADRIKALTKGAATDAIAGMSREDCARRIEALTREREDAITDKEIAEAERDEAVKRMEAGWIQVCAEPAIKHFKERAEKAERDAERWRCIRSMLWWRTDPFAQDVGNMNTGYWQTKLFKQLQGKPDLDAAIDAARAALDAKEGSGG